VVLGRLPRSRFWDWAAAIGVAFFVAESTLIDLQQWRGVPSHFNGSTAFDEAVFNAMAFCIVVVGIGIAVLAIRSLGHVDGPPSTAWAVRAGMTFLLLGQVLGGLIIANYFTSDVPLARASIVGAAGELKVPHTALAAVAPCALGYALVLAAATLQTYSGLGPLAFSPLALLATLAGAVLVAGPYLRGLMALRRPSLA